MERFGVTTGEAKGTKKFAAPHVDETSINGFDQATFDKYYEKVEKMNPISPQALESSKHMGEYAAILKSEFPDLIVVGPYKDKATGATYLG